MADALKQIMTELIEDRGGRILSKKSKRLWNTTCGDIRFYGNKATLGTLNVTQAINPYRYYLTPKHRKVPSTPYATADLPKLLKDDAICKWLGFGVGDLIEITRSRAFAYREVIEK